MEEDQNQEQKQDNAVEKLAKKGGNEILNKGAQQAKKFVVQKIVPAIIPAILVVVKIIAGLLVAGILVAGFEWVIDNVISKDTSEKVQDIIGDYCVVEEDGIKFNKEALQKEIEEELATGGIDKEKLGFGLEEDEASEFLYDLMATSLSSQLPYIKGSDKEAQGIIYLYRDINKDGVVAEDEELEFVRTN